MIIFGTKSTRPHGVTKNRLDLEVLNVRVEIRLWDNSRSFFRLKFFRSKIWFLKLEYLFKIECEKPRTNRCYNGNNFFIRNIWKYTFFDVKLKRYSNSHLLVLGRHQTDTFDGTEHLQPYGSRPFSFILRYFVLHTLLIRLSFGPKLSVQPFLKSSTDSRTA